MTVTSATTASQVYATNKITATKATSAYENTAPVQTQQTDKMAEMKEKYKDVYTPIPETYSKADEDIQAQKIHEAYPNYISGPDFLKLVDQFYDGEPIIPGNGITQEQKEKQEVAFQKVYDQFGGEDAYKKMQKDVQAIKEQYPINEWAKQGYADNSKELARFTNATIYEGLERGLSLEGATKEARSVENIFMDVSYGAKMLDDMLIKAGRMSPAPEGGRETVRMDVDFNAIKNAAMDLRGYGIDGAWNGKKFIENQKDMLQEITTKISQFNFMLDHKELVDDARMKLPEYSRGPINNEGYESWVNEEVLPRMQVGYEVFSKYQIYDSIDIKV